MSIECEMREGGLYIRWEDMSAGKVAALVYGALTQMDGLEACFDGGLALYEPSRDPADSPMSTTIRKLNATFGGPLATSLRVGMIRSKPVTDWYNIQLGVPPHMDAVLITPTEYAPEGILERIYKIMQSEAVAEELFEAAKDALPERPPRRSPPKGRRRIEDLEDL